MCVYTCLMLYPSVSLTHSIFLSYPPPLSVSFSLPLFLSPSLSPSPPPSPLSPLSLSSVEHDFRQQEGRFQPVMETLDRDYDFPLPVPKPAPAHPNTKTLVKKLRKKCFWWL